MDILAYIIRCVVMFAVTWAAIRLMGKKSISNMTSYELTATLIISNVAAEPMVYKIVSKASVGVVTLAVITILIGSLSLKSPFYDFNINPTILVVNGKILYKNLKNVKMNVPLLMADLRSLGYANLSEIAYAIFEPNGRISAIPISQKRPVEPSDMAINTKPVHIAFPVIIDGKVKQQNLIFFKKNIKWLNEQLKNQGIKGVEDVLFAQIDTEGNLYIDLKNKHIPIPDVE